MPDPMNYMLANVPNPMQSVMQGIQSSFGIQALSDEQKMRQAAIQAEADKRQREQAFNEDAAMLYDKLSVDGINRMMAKYPEFASRFDKLKTGLTEEQTRANMAKASELFVASHKNPEIVNSLFDKQIEAAKNAGKTDEVQALTTMKELNAKDPKAFQLSAATGLAVIMGPEKFASNFKELIESPEKLAMAPVKVKEAEAKAAEAAVKAKFAESTAVTDLQKKGWDIQKIQNDMEIAKQNAKIAAINASIAQQSNAIRMQELMDKRKDMEMARDEKVRAKQAEAEGALQFTDSTSELLNWLVDPKQKSARQSATGTVSMTLPGTEGRTYVSKIEQLTNMMALPNLDKLKGAMSDKDILFLKKISANLDRTQEESAFLNELQRLQKFMKEKKVSIQNRYGMPEGKAPSPGAGQQVFEVNF